MSLQGVVQVDLSHISFRYPTRRDVVALEDVTLKLEPGKLVALVGLSGSGKSTLVALLQRLYDPGSGQVSTAAALSRLVPPTVNLYSFSLFQLEETASQLFMRYNIVLSTEEVCTVFLSDMSANLHCE